MVLIQMDANAKVGQNIISADPNNVTDSNGRQLLDLVDRYGLELLNADAMCTGAITRYRMSKKCTEIAILDYVLVCKELYQYFEKLVIDEERRFTLTKYATTKGKKKKITSDHNPMFANFNIEYQKIKMKEERREIFNLKNEECQSNFFQETKTGNKLQNCFSSDRSFEEKCKKFMNTLDNVLHK